MHTLRARTSSAVFACTCACLGIVDTRIVCPSRHFPFHVCPPRMPVFSCAPIAQLWVSREEENMSMPVAAHSWVEVTHCAERFWGRGPSAPPVGASGWQYGPMWLYSAPGSGLSVNVGRTLATSHFDAAQLLRLLYARCRRGPACAPIQAGLYQGPTKP